MPYHFPQSLHHFNIPKLLHIFTNTFVFDISHPNRYEVMSHYGFDLHFRND